MKCKAFAYIGICPLKKDSACSGQMLFALILAAGRSSRMQREKALLPWLDGAPLIGWMISALRDSGWQPLVVAGPHNQEQLRGHLPGGSLILNPAPERGKTSSITCGLLGISSNPEALLLTAIDQPRPASLYRALKERFVGLPATAILQPATGRHRDHPIILGSAHLAPLLGLNEASAGLRGYLADHEPDRHTLPWPADQLGFDLNDPVRYEAALHAFRQFKD